ncbi:cytokine receptor-like factor 3 [Physella acuta]|uniref:cytokine receptor-like factor 3 n=1 Tax=Physella acuta TaxID=109671 RepID=UPI0027DCBC08|nr:cytokine receptor-like factor 3 [Physella acuta]XP_059174546.1 cytokine receptor-like factor 3 [Physella acuta]XP_059174627.1 cytokine receptor-like factor 3 [Physella acuta]XP_059174700.1 cytokine receptor-like factor 3 [Physella acuta]
MAAEMVQSVIEIMDSAHNYRYELAEVLDGIKSLQYQINWSSDSSKKAVETHFTLLKSSLITALDKRLDQLNNEIETIRESALKPLDECKTLVDESLKLAAQVMDEGASILSIDPENNVDKILKFKENPITKSLSSVPAIPSLAEVACVNVSLSPDFQKQMEAVISLEGKVMARAPVQIIDAIEKPGSLLLQWADEADEDVEINEFWLQYAMGSYKDTNEPNAVFHTAYTGSSTSHLVKHLRTQTPYTFRVCGRGEASTPWSAWSVPKIAATTILHYQWGPSENPAYALSNENKTATRTSKGLTHVLYSNTASFIPGNILTIKVLDGADKSPGDGLCICLKNTDNDHFGQDGVVYVNLYGSIFVDGQEKTMKLPEIKKGSVVSFQAEELSNGKVRVSIQTEDKEVTFDWKVLTSSSSLGLLSAPGDASNSHIAFYFGIKFSQEDWKIAVD